tara:strand:- start:337 stop:588 length:252 start_codon:yes stop_codon:yes gene_type:complete
MKIGFLGTQSFLPNYQKILKMDFSKNADFAIFFVNFHQLHSFCAFWSPKFISVIEFLLFLGGRCKRGKSCIGTTITLGPHSLE